MLLVGVVLFTFIVNPISTENSDLEALQRECKDGTFGYRCLFTCRCYRNRVCDKKTGRCPRDECANGFWGEGCQLGVYYVQCSTKVIHLFLRLVYRAALFWFVSLSCFSLAISFIINQIKTTCTYERERV